MVQYRMVRKSTHNSPFTIGGISYSADSFVVRENLILPINNCVEKPPISNRQNINFQKMCQLEHNHNIKLKL